MFLLGLPLSRERPSARRRACFRPFRECSLMGKHLIYPPHASIMSSNLIIPIGGDNMKFKLLELISLLTQNKFKYCAYLATYENHENENLVIIPNENFISHAIYLYDHFNLDAIAYNQKSPLIQIKEFAFFNSLEEIPETVFDGGLHHGC